MLVIAETYRVGLSSLSWFLVDPLVSTQLRRLAGLQMHQMKHATGQGLLFVSALGERSEAGCSSTPNQGGPSQGSGNRDCVRPTKAILQNGSNRSRARDFTCSRRAMNPPKMPVLPNMAIVE